VYMISEIASVLALQTLTYILV